MRAPGAGLGLGLLLDREGRVAEVLKDDAGILADFAGGLHFPALLAAGETAAGLDLMREAKVRGKAGPAPLVLRDGTRLRCRAYRAGAGLLVLGGAPEAAAAALDAAEEDWPDGEGPDDRIYNETSRLNNELLDARRALEKRNAELNRLDAVKDKFLGIAAHDLRSPLGSVRSFCELLADPEVQLAPEELKRFSEAAVVQINYMLRLVNDLLDTEAFERGEPRIYLGETDLAALAAPCAGAGRVQAQAKKLDLVLEDPPGPLPVLADAQRVVQAANNLINNAIKYSMPGATVRVRFEAEGGSCAIVVEDQGLGMDEATLASLAVPFGAASRRGTAGEKSTGLGLYIAKRIAEAHKGSLEIRSSPGKGTTARLSFPLLGAKGPEA